MEQQLQLTPIVPDLVRFGDFLLDLQTGELRRRDQVVPLRPLATRCLVLLVSGAGRLVTTEELRQELWGATVVDWNAGIHQTIRQIRLALEDSHHTVVETVIRRGYRFGLPVVPVTAPRRAARGSKFVNLRVYAAGFATPFLLVIGFFVWCGTFL